MAWMWMMMSRARRTSHVWTVADDLPQAVDDLRRDWSTRRTPIWAIDIAIPDPRALNQKRFRGLPCDQQTRVAALLHAEHAVGGQAITGMRLPDRAATLGQAEQALDTARQARVDLDTGAGVWANTEAGRAVRDLAEARAERQRAKWAINRATRWRDRHAARKEVAEWTRREADANRRWADYVTPEVARLDQDIAGHQATLDQTAFRFDRRKAATQSVLDHGLEQRRQVTKLADRITAERDHLDGVPSAADVRRAAMRQEQLRHLGHTPEYEPPTPQLHGVEM